MLQRSSRLDYLSVVDVTYFATFGLPVGRGVSTMTKTRRWFTTPLTIIVPLFLVLTAAQRGVDATICPVSCNCRDQQRLVDCSYQSLYKVPKNIPPHTERLDLQGNNITVIRRTDLRGLKKLRVLQLAENQIHTIEKGSFQDLISMHRLRLNRNKLKTIPDYTFINMPSLYRLDLSFNRLRVIGPKTLSGAPLLLNLQIDHNDLRCIAESALRGLVHMEIFTANKNNLTVLPANVFEGMAKLRVMRISDNHFVCDCHMAWLAKWLEKYPRLGHYAECSAPKHLRNQPLSQVNYSDFKCKGMGGTRQDTECRTDLVCPRECSCTGTLVDCRDKGLSQIPDNIPASTMELRLEQNFISHVPSKAFLELKKLKRLDLSNNQITYIAPDAFLGLQYLNSLVLFGNKIKEVTINVFTGLVRLQLLLLNANKISCIHENLFQDLHSLNLLSLYDNKIQSLGNKTFLPLANIQTLHLGRNPFICDCNLQWLADYLHKHPIETSGARCEAPRRMRRKRLGQVRRKRFRCRGSEKFRTQLAGQCLIDSKCPKKCKCEHTKVDCSSRKLTEFPKDLPMFATQLILSGNEIKKLGKLQLDKLPNLKLLNLETNKIDSISDDAFKGASKLEQLHLTDNAISGLSAQVFSGLRKLKILYLQTNQLTCIHNDTFLDTTLLKTLSLYDNKIRCVMNGAFNHLTYLNTLNLMANPFHCNCHLSWLPDWLKKRKVITGNPVCFSPHTLKDSTLTDLQGSDLVCEENTEIGCHQGIPPCCSRNPADNEGNSCDPRAYCPPKCKCTGTIIRCTRLKLTVFPENIPLDTTELYLEMNSIQSIPQQIGRLKKLTRLDLSNNAILTLHSSIFSNLTLLETLILSYNKLECIAPTSFSKLNKLRLLSLHANNLSTLPYGAFKDLTSLTQVALGGNPLYCNCRLKWLSEWIKKDFVESGIATCAGPAEMKNKLILTTELQYFQCLEDPDPSVSAKCDACFNNPCQHGGKCHPVGFKDYSCLCTQKYHGKKCELEIDACYGTPCLHEGACQVQSHGRYSCGCGDGFKGERCETNIDDCVTNLCKENSTCVDGVQTYTCQCLPGFTGKYCDKKIYFCVGDYNFCMNRGKCIDLKTDYRCLCKEGFTGKNCSINVNDCVSNLCQNGATCLDGLNTYLCKCAPTYRGKFCEVAPTVTGVYRAPRACDNHDCQNKGVCYKPYNAPDYMCKCVAGFSGKMCEKLTSVHMTHKDSYMQLMRVDIMPFANITVVMATKHSTGVLLYVGMKQHVAIELFRGRIRVSFDIGNSPVSTMFSYEKVDDGNYHKLEMWVRHKNFTMKIDGHAARTILNEGRYGTLRVNDYLYVGGLPRLVNDRAFQRWHIRDGSSFHGCFKSVHINGRQVDFHSSTNRNKVFPGCPADEPIDPCVDNRCQNGRCKPKKRNPNGYRCRCRKGYSGEFCDRAPTCKEFIYREVYVDPNTSCKSRTKVKHRRCLGSCGRFCCKARRMKTRKVRLYCPNGDAYHHDVTVVRKCGCRKCRKHRLKMYKKVR